MSQFAPLPSGERPAFKINVAATNNVRDREQLPHRHRPRLHLISETDLASVSVSTVNLLCRRAQPNPPPVQLTAASGIELRGRNSSVCF